MRLGKRIIYITYTVPLFAQNIQAKFQNIDISFATYVAFNTSLDFDKDVVSLHSRSEYSKYRPLSLSSLDHVKHFEVS